MALSLVFADQDGVVVKYFKNSSDVQIGQMTLWHVFNQAQTIHFIVIRWCYPHAKNPLKITFVYTEKNNW